MANAGRVAIVPKGDYSSSTAYNRLDLVRYNEKAYVAKKANTGIAPTNTEYWMLMTSDGITIDTALSDTSTNPVQNKVVKNALDNIQTTSRATLSTAGWYRVAEYERNQDYAYYDVTFKLVTAYSSIGAITGTFVARCSRRNVVLKALGTVTSGTHFITQLRVTYDGTKYYLEIYYSTDSANANDCMFMVSNPMANRTTDCWKAIDFIPTEETVDGVTVTTTYDIPSNASPVTDLDLAQFNGTKVLNTSILEYALTLENGFHNIALGGASYPSNLDLPHNNYRYSEATIIKQSSSTITVIVWGRRSGTPTLYPPVFNCYNGTEWGGWQTFATTADLANYLPLTGGNLSGNLGLYYGSSELMGYTNHLNIVQNSVTDGVADSNNLRFLSLYSAKEVSDIKNALLLRDKVNGTTKDYTILHTGNSAKVVVSETAPTDTSALWVDKTNKKTKAYIDGAWTVIA